MTGDRRPGAALAIGKGNARPLPEPAIRLRKAAAGRRVGACLPTETYVRFKAYVARHGTTGERVIVSAIELLLEAG